MAKIHIWAPEAEAVELDCGDRLVSMAKSVAGWWMLDAPFIDHGADYAFRVDGKGPFPDPRSPWQPQGVHGPSRWVDHARFSWSDSGWQQPPLGSAVIYELHVGTFTPKGIFQSAIERLEALVELGVTHVELMPVAEFSGNRGWGYDGVDLYAPHQAYGGPEGLKRLVDACHNRGLAVLLDVVYNHLGPAGNYLGQFGPYFTNRHSTPWGQAVNFDGPDSDEVRCFFVENALMWLRDYHMDGLRIDAIHAIIDTSAIHFLEQLAAAVKDLETESGRHLVLIAESDLNDPRVVSPSEVGGYGLDAQWNEDFHHSLHAVLTGENDGYYRDFEKLADLAKSLSKGLVYDGRYSAYRRRHHGRSATGLSGHRFVGCLQNHDQVGNRAVGDRTSHLVSQDRLKIGAALVLTAPFVPMLFQGEEWAASTPFLYFTDHQDPELGAAVKAGRQTEFVAFGWKPADIPDPQDEKTFLRSKLDWDELGRAPHNAIYEWHRALISLRRRFSALCDGRMERTGVHFDEDARWLIIRRGEVSVVCNLAEVSQSLPCAKAADQTILLSTHSAIALENNGIFLPPVALAILKSSKNQD